MPDTNHGPASKCPRLARGLKALVRRRIPTKTWWVAGSQGGGQCLHLTARVLAAHHGHTLERAYGKKCMDIFYF